LNLTSFSDILTSVAYTTPTNENISCNDDDDDNNNNNNPG